MSARRVLREGRRERGKSLLGEEGSAWRVVREGRSNERNSLPFRYLRRRVVLF